MKLSPNTKLNIIFWSITIPVLPIIIAMLAIAILIALVPLFRNRTLNTVEKVILKFALWRNNLPIVKNAYDKVHLFDYLRESS